MDINFYYIAGLDRYNIYNFSTSQEMTTFLNSKLITKVNLSFFPPKYTDQIKVEYEDLSLETSVNYLSIVFRGRTYYYFIESIEYVNEDVYIINISLDSIMTYYFDIEFSDGIVERKHIKRWNGNIINRAYIRENVSNGLFEYNDKSTVTHEKWIVVKSTSVYLVASYKAKFDTITTKNGQVHTSCGFFIGPYELNAVDYNVNWLPPSQDEVDNYVSTYPYPTILSAMNSDKTIDAYILPFCPVTGMSYSYDLIPGTAQREVIFNVEKLRDKTDESILPLIGLKEDEITGVSGNPATHGLWHTKYYSTLISLGFTKNTTLGLSHTYLYEPCLLDENYFRIIAGTNSAYATYPVHTLRLPSITFAYHANIDDASCIYTLYSQVDNDIFSNSVIDTNMASISLFNSPWQNYLANIKSRVVATSLSAVTSLATMFTGIASNSVYANRARNEILSNKSNYDKRYKIPTLKKRAQREMNIISNRQGDRNAEAISSFSENFLGSMANDISSAFNALYTPPSPKQLGSAVTNLNSYDFQLWHQRLIVNDIAEVAEYYHRRGNLVNTYVTYNEINTDNYPLFHYFITRHYFNYLKFASLDITLKCLSDREFVDDIMERLMHGITIWNLSVPIGTYQYDNVEEDYL